MNYIDEYDLVAEDVAGFPGSSPRSLNGGIDQFFSSPLPEDAELDDDVIEIDDFDDIDTDSDLFVSDDRDFHILESDQDELDGDLVLDSDDAIPTHHDTWDDQDGDENSSPRSSSPTGSLGSELGDALEREFATISEDDDNIDPASRAQSAENLESRYQHFQSQLDSLNASRARIADAFRELTARNVATSRRWEEELRSGLGRRDPVRADRLSAISGSSRENQRHHPYNRMPPPPAREGSSLGEMASGPQRRSERSTTQSIVHNLDELVEVEVEGVQSRRRRTQTPGNPARTAEASARTVIDLTEEPDSPDGPLNATGHTRNRVRPPPPPNIPLTLPSTTHRNPRRQLSLNHRTPSLTRSDGSLLGNRAGPQTNVIDLTMDEDSSPPPRNTRQGANAPRANPPRQRPTFTPPDITHESQHDFGIISLFHRAGTGGLAGIDIISRIGSGFGAAGGLFRRQVIDEASQTFHLPHHATPHFHAPDPLAGNLPNFNYRANGYNGGGSVKPVHQAPEKARDGFSRSTGEDQTFVCPSCEKELAYDPDEETRGAPATKKARTKKDREEHYFWAVKECGHVSYLCFLCVFLFLFRPRH